MANKIHIYVHYNLLNCKYVDDLRAEENFEEIVTTETAIITDEALVRRILQHSKTKVNEYGEFTSYDESYLRTCLSNDLYLSKLNFEEYISTSGTDGWFFEIRSFYYIKCEVVRNISAELASFMNN